VKKKTTKKRAGDPLAIEKLEFEEDESPENTKEKDSEAESNEES